MKKKVYHIGDYVKIINPEIFVRCGYPLSLEDAKSKLVTDREKTIICHLLGFDDGKETTATELISYSSPRTNDTYNKILNELSYYKLKGADFGGKSRRIHTKNDSAYKDTIGTVLSKRVVRTGNYNSGSMSRGYYDMYDEYEPPYLGNVESHVLLTISSIEGLFEIEECNVEEYIYE